MSKNNNINIRKNGDKNRNRTDTGVDDTLVEVNKLKKHYISESSWKSKLLNEDPTRVKAVDGVSFEINRGDTLGIVGESGCGKSTLAETVLGVHEPTEGNITIGGKDITEQKTKDRSKLARRIQLVFQDASSCLDPRLTLREIIQEPLDIHSVGTKEHRANRVEKLVEQVGLSVDQLDRYPAEFSGGQRQRINIARSLALDPELLILDEPTSALDVSVQAQILNLLKDIQSEFELTYIFISHDLSVIRYMCDRTLVMYLGKVAEIGPTDEIFNEPSHPYTRALLNSAPDLRNKETTTQLIDPDIPSPRNPPSGCRFHTRCSEVLMPKQYSDNLSQETWLGIFDYKLKLRSGDFTEESIRDLAEIKRDTPISEDDVRELIYDECEIPKQIMDDTAEMHLNDSIDLLLSGKEQEALALMNAEFNSPCEFTQPSMTSVSDSHEVACLLNIDEY